MLYRRRREHERKQIQCGLEQPLEQQNHDYSHPLTQVWRDSSKISNNVEVYILLYPTPLLMLTYSLLPLCQKIHSRDHIFIREKENRQLHELTCIEQEEEHYTVLIQTLIRRKLAQILANRMRLQSMTEVQRTVGRKIAALEVNHHIFLFVFILSFISLSLPLNSPIQILQQEHCFYVFVQDCMFYALSHNLYGDVSRHAEIRREVSDWLALNGDYNMVCHPSLLYLHLLFCSLFFSLSWLYRQVDYGPADLPLFFYLSPPSPHCPFPVVSQLT